MFDPQHSNSSSSMSDVAFDAELIRRYDRNGPRYTSYPTAIEFHNLFTVDDYRAAAEASNAAAGPLSLYVHVPFCTSPCFYCACNRIITRDHSKAETYLTYLTREIGLQAALFDASREVRQLHFGGGTPTFLSLQQMSALLSSLRRHFNLSDDADREFSIEIDPRTLQPESLRCLSELGFNRLSLGVQDFDPEVQAAVNREQSQIATLCAIDTAREVGFNSVSVDLIYGLPKQNTAKFEWTLSAVIAAQPDRIAVYGYAHMPRLFKAQRQINDADLPSAAVRLALLQQTIELLTAAGYVYIGMDHFARADDELVKAQRAGTLQRNFQGYSTCAEYDLIGLGVSSIGKVANTYAQNAKTLDAYYLLLANDQLPLQRGIVLSEDDIIRRVVIQEVMCHARLDYAQLSDRLGIRFEHYFADELRMLTGMQRDGLLDFNSRGLQVTPQGRLLLRHVAMIFDAYLGQAAQHSFSKAV